MWASFPTVSAQPPAPASAAATPSMRVNGQRSSFAYGPK